MTETKATIGFLACQTTLPQAQSAGAERRGDAYEHDLMVSALAPALASENMALKVIDWEAPEEDFAGVDLVLLGTAWNYQDRAHEFLAKLETLAGLGIEVGNRPEIVRWNIEKTYLRELEAKGARTIPTLWREVVSSKGVNEAFNVFDCDRVVVKRQIGAGAEGQELVARGALPDADWKIEQPCMIQPFIHSIAEEGELSFVFVDGVLSHALRKRAAKGDYRIQSIYGGIEEIYHPGNKEAEAARAIIEALPFEAPLYARIDMVRMEEDALAVMEAELIEPYLYPEQGPLLGKHLAKAIAKRLKR